MRAGEQLTEVRWWVEGNVTTPDSGGLYLSRKDRAASSTWISEAAMSITLFNQGGGEAIGSNSYEFTFQADTKYALAVQNPTSDAADRAGVFSLGIMVRLGNND